LSGSGTFRHETSPYKRRFFAKGQHTSSKQTKGNDRRGRANRKPRVSAEGRARPQLTAVSEHQNFLKPDQESPRPEQFPGTGKRRVNLTTC
jgi:hypothetical protein